MDIKSTDEGCARCMSFLSMDLLTRQRLAISPFPDVELRLGLGDNRSMKKRVSQCA
jgi:hypothetical protein